MLSPATGGRPPQREGEGRWIRVTFRFYLSLQGRRPHLAQGGDARRNQRLTADISQEDVAFVHVDPAGKATADLRTVRGPAGRLTEIEFNTVPSAPGLFAYLRRQKELVLLVGSPQAVGVAVRTENTSRRYAALPRRFELACAGQPTTEAEAPLPPLADHPVQPVEKN